MFFGVSSPHPTHILDWFPAYLGLVGAISNSPATQRLSAKAWTNSHFQIKPFEAQRACRDWAKKGIAYRPRHEGVIYSFDKTRSCEPRPNPPTRSATKIRSTARVLRWRWRARGRSRRWKDPHFWPPTLETQKCRFRAQKIPSSNARDRRSGWSLHLRKRIRRWIGVRPAVPRHRKICTLKNFPDWPDLPIPFGSWTGYSETLRWGLRQETPPYNISASCVAGRM